MADYNEAIKNLQTIQGMPLTIRMAIEALEKQIPKRPTLHDYTITLPFLGDKQEFDFLCVSCGCAVYSDDNCCPNCGQAIDWSDE